MQTAESGPYSERADRRLQEEIGEEKIEKKEFQDMAEERLLERGRRSPDAASSEEPDQTEQDDDVAVELERPIRFAERKREKARKKQFADGAARPPASHEEASPQRLLEGVERSAELGPSAEAPEEAVGRPQEASHAPKEQPHVPDAVADPRVGSLQPFDSSHGGSCSSPQAATLAGTVHLSTRRVITTRSNTGPHLINNIRFNFPILITTTKPIQSGGEFRFKTIY